MAIKNLEHPMRVLQTLISNPYARAAVMMAMEQSPRAWPVGAPNDFIRSGQVNCPGVKVLRQRRKTLGRRKAPPPASGGVEVSSVAIKNLEHPMRVLQILINNPYARAAVMMAME